MEAVIVDYSQWCPYVFLKGSVHNHALTPIKTGSKIDANPAAREPISKNYKIQNTKNKQIPNYNVQNYKQLRHVIYHLSSVFCLLSSHHPTFYPSSFPPRSPMTNDQ